ncbi:MAG: thiamine ABC transporter substrate-binding protein [Acidimicrobiales bacterium]
MRPTRNVILLALFGVVALSACGSDARPSASSSGSGSSGQREAVTLLTHGAFAVSADVLQAFEAATGIDVVVQKGDDAGALVNQAILTKDNPQGDVLYGVDNTLIGKALDAGLLEPYDSRALAEIDTAYELDPAQHRVTPVDYSDVCVNTDKRAFDAPGKPAAPTSLEDLAAPEHKGQLVVENPATSSTGLAFLLATIARYGDDGYLAYWARLKANGVKVVEGWTQAYQDEFSAGGGGGDRPLVVSYATSPPADVIGAASPKPTTDVGVVNDGCYRQIEGAGILSGTKHRGAAEKLVDFLAGPEVQADVALQMFVFPVRTGTALPDVFTEFAVRVDHPLVLPPGVVAAERDRWVTDWTDSVLR